MGRVVASTGALRVSSVPTVRRALKSRKASAVGSLREVETRWAAEPVVTVRSLRNVLLLLLALTILLVPALWLSWPLRLVMSRLLLAPRRQQALLQSRARSLGPALRILKGSLLRLALTLLPRALRLQPRLMLRLMLWASSARLMLWASSAVTRWAPLLLDFLQKAQRTRAVLRRTTLRRNPFDGRADERGSARGGAWPRSCRCSPGGLGGGWTSRWTAWSWRGVALMATVLWGGRWGGKTGRGLFGGRAWCGVGELGLGVFDQAIPVCGPAGGLGG